MDIFKYDEGGMFKDEFINCFQCDKIRYKKCIVEIELVYIVVCRNLDLGDDIKEIIIFG